MASINCSECGEILSKDDKNCPKCQHEIAQPVTKVQKIEGFFLKLFTYGCLINIAIIILVLLGLIVADLFF